VDKALPEKQKILAAMASDLLANKGAGVVMVGAAQPADVHARALRINAMLENLGQTVQLHAVPDAPESSGVDQLKQLTDEINGGSISTLLILAGNPVFYAPSDLRFQEALARVPNSLHLGLYRNETSRSCQWHLNAAHPLESWGDGRSYDGTVCLAQPMIEPLFDGRSELELLAALIESHEESHAGDDGGEHAGEHAGQPVNAGLRVVKETAARFLGGNDPETAWMRSLQAGFIAGTESTPATPSLAEVTLESGSEDWTQVWDGGDPELIFRPSKSIYDGRYANNGWLQELPEFLTKLTWDNAALASPATAEALNLQQGKLANFKVDENQITLPVYILPGLPEGTVCTWLGYGREAAGRVAGDADISIGSIGHDVRPLRTSGNWWSVPAVVTDPTSTSWLLATTQDHFEIDALGREEINKRMAPEDALVRAGTWESFQEFLAGEDHAGEEDHAEDDHAAHARHWPGGHHLHFENFDLTRAGWLDEKVDYKWGMSIDLNRCTGCNACVVACQSENNIPVVGKQQVSKGREMQWMRIDRYFITEAGDEQGKRPYIAHQPLTCQQCEKAPCETVCPVAATVHSDEGLNDMVYNRCIGTRYCGNNCPYKVRRFNYFNYTDAQTFLKIPGADRLQKADLQLQSLMMNPEVTVRSRGVMEKCTYCVQRIQNTKILCKTEGNRKVGPNEITTACQDVCPTKAIVFGDIQNEQSDVYHNHHNPRAYTLLEELNVYPRTRYLARVTNPHPALAGNRGVTAH
jgi:molybdopterin-containing oxidoreductase family iron-sulfur binding subunit